MFCCILTTSSGQHIKLIKYHIYKSTTSIAKIEVSLLQITITIYTYIWEYLQNILAIGQLNVER